jgi:hypothetical protein
MKYRIIGNNLQTKEKTQWGEKTFSKREAQSFIDELNSKPVNDTIYEIEPDDEAVSR